MASSTDDARSFDQDRQLQYDRAYKKKLNCLISNFLSPNAVVLQMFFTCLSFKR